MWERDGGQCTYVSREGKRCPARESLEYHHDDPYGLGGDRSATNIRLMCTLCRYRHNPHYADYQIMPRRVERVALMRSGHGLDTMEESFCAA